MDYTVIEVPDMNDSLSRIVLGGIYCQIRFTYNDTKGFWYFGIYDDMDEPIAIGLKIVPNMVLNLFFGTDELPNGAFGVLTSLSKIGRDDFKKGNAQFIFCDAENAETLLET